MIEAPTAAPTRPGRALDVPPAPGGAQVPNYYTRLTARELQVVELVAQGRSNDQIATALALSTQSVARYVSVLIARMHVPNRAALVARAYTQGLLDGREWPPRAAGGRPAAP